MKNIKEGMFEKRSFEYQKKVKQIKVANYHKF